MNLKKYINHQIKLEYHNFILNCIQIYGLQAVTANIYKSSLINIDILKLLYDKIIETDSDITNLMLNNLFIKVVQYNFGKEINETDLDNYLKTVKIHEYNNHSCSYNYHNYRQSTCEFSIFRSFSTCLYFYTNDTHLAYNRNISHNFAKKYLSPENLKKFEKNIIKVNTGFDIHYTDVMDDFNNKCDINSILEHFNDTKKKNSLLLSINSSLLWEDIEKYKDKLNIDYLFINTFEKQIKKIKNRCIYFWQAKCKIENWLFRCYWDPRSTFRQNKLEESRLEFIEELS